MEIIKLHRDTSMILPLGDIKSISCSGQVKVQIEYKNCAIVWTGYINCSTIELPKNLPIDPKEHSLILAHQHSCDVDVYLNNIV